MRFLSVRFRQLFQPTIDKVREINRKYAVPAVKTSRNVSLALLLLRVYLVALILILLFKFFTLAL
jgi:hypothetical protein